MHNLEQEEKKILLFQAFQFCTTFTALSLCKFFPVNSEQAEDDERLKFWNPINFSLGLSIKVTMK